MLDLFNMGKNNGTIAIISNQNVINCHDFVFFSQCNYGYAMCDFNDIIQNTCDKHQIILNNDYKHHVIICVISSMYSTQYILPKLEFQDLCQIIVLADELLVSDTTNLIPKIKDNMQSCMDRHWFDIMDLVLKDYRYKFLQNMLEHYIVYNIFKNTHIIESILNDADLCCTIRTYLSQLIGHLDKKKLYLPYVKPEWEINLWNQEPYIPSFENFDPSNVENELMNVHLICENLSNVFDRLSDDAIRASIKLSEKESNSSPHTMQRYWIIIEKILLLPLQLEFAWP